MALADSSRQRIVMFCGMYFAQGVPWGFMGGALVTYLTEQGISVDEAGELSAIILVPWTFKLIWGPIIDSVTVRSMGRRRAWIIGAELMMAVSLLGLLVLGDLKGNLQNLALMFFIHNCFASLQDVATDALAVDLLPAEEQGRVNGLMWGSKLVGQALGTMGFARVMVEWGLEAAVLLQFVLLLAIMLLPVLMLERAGEKRFPWSPGEAGVVPGQSSLRSPLEVTRDLFRAFRLRATLAFLIYGLFHVIGWGLIEVYSKAVCTQELKWSTVEFSDVAGWAVIPVLVLTQIAGWAADRYGRRKVMLFGFGGYGLMHIVFGSCPGMWHEQWFVWTYLFLIPGILAIGSVGFNSMGMQVCWTRSQATMFTIFMTMSNVGHVVGGSIAGPVKELVPGYEGCFIAAGLAMFAPLLLLPLVTPEQVEQARRADES